MAATDHAGEVLSGGPDRKWYGFYDPVTFLFQATCWDGFDPSTSFPNLTIKDPLNTQTIVSPYVVKNVTVDFQQVVTWRYAFTTGNTWGRYVYQFYTQVFSSPSMEGDFYMLPPRF